MIDQQWLDSQNGAIGSCLLDAELVPVLIAETRAADFDGPARKVWIAFSELLSENKPADAISVNERLRGEYHDYLMQVMEITPSTAPFQHYVDKTRKRAMLNKVRAALIEAAASDDLGDMQKAIDKASAALVSQKSSTEKRDISSLLVDFFERKRNKIQYMDSGFAAFNRHTYLEPGDFVVVGGAPSSGKTAIAAQMASTQAKGYRVGFYSLETRQEKVVDRLMSLWSDVSMSKIKTADLSDGDWENLTKAASNLSTHHMEIVRAGGWGVDEIFRDAVAHRYQVIYIDYLQIVNVNARSRYEIVTEISSTIHQYAQRTQILTVALSQLSRLEKNEKPTMRDLRESGQIEQDADLIILLHEPANQNGQCNRIADIAKNKEGLTGSIGMIFNGSKQKFVSVSLRKPPAEPSRKKYNGQFKKLPDSTPVPEAFTQDVVQEV